MSLLTLSRGDHRLVDLPSSWSNRGRREQLQRAAAESFSNLIAIAVADSGTNFQLYDALRPLEEQEEIFFDRYRRTGWGTKRNSSDRWHDGAVWRKVKGANAAAPGWSNHGSGLAVDIHPGPIQDVVKAKGPAWGWSWEEGRENGEDWHFVFVGGNRYANRGWLDHAAVQRAVGADVDGKIGTGTVAKIKSWQKARGMEADGIVGPATKAAMLGKAVADSIPPILTGGTSVPSPQPDAERTELEPAVDGKFRWADTTTQFWDDKYPGQTYQGGDPKGLLHSTETGTWPGYGGGSSAPHLTIRFHPDSETIEVRQHFSTTRPSRALVNKAGGVQTNNQRVFQAELVGSCDRAFATKHSYPYLPDLLTEPWARGALAAVLAAVSASLGIPLTTSVEWERYPGSYGEHAPQRLTGQAWTDYEGWLGHQHAPENDHGDPGDIPVAAILAADGGAPSPAVTPPPAPVTGVPTGKALLMALIAAPDFPLLRTSMHRCFYGPRSGPMESVSGHVPNSLNPGDVTSKGSAGLKDWQAQMVKRGYSLKVDGLYGDKTAAAADNLQRLAGITRDELIGPDTFYAAWLLPVQ